MENNESEKRERKLIDLEYRLRGFSDSTKHNSICIVGVPDQVQEAQRTPLKINKNRSTGQHVTVKPTKYQDKERILKAPMGKRSLTCKGRHIRLAADLSTVT